MKREKEYYKVGDVVWVKQIFGGFFTAKIEAVVRDFFGIYYIATWMVDCDGAIYSVSDKLRPRNIIMKR